MPSDIKLYCLAREHQWLGSLHTEIKGVDIHTQEPLVKPVSKWLVGQLPKNHTPSQELMALVGCAALLAQIKKPDQYVTIHTNVASVKAGVETRWHYGWQFGQRLHLGKHFYDSVYMELIHQTQPHRVQFIPWDTQSASFLEHEARYAA
jgi:hypothetical protein